MSRYDVVREGDLVSLKDEIDSANHILDDIEHVLPNGCKKVLLEGNHDQRPEKYRLNSWDKDVQKLWGKKLENADVLYHCKKRGWEWHNYGEVYKHGKALFTHGWFVNSYHAQKTVRRWFKSIFYGHTHTYQTHSILGMDKLPVTGMSIGTLSRLDLDYLNGIPPDWVQMFMPIEFMSDGSFTPHPIPIIKGRFAFNGTQFG